VAVTVASTAGPLDVWLDVDPAAGLPDQEVDDALALIQAFHSPELRVRCVSVVYGNAALDESLPIARELTERFGPPGITVHAGAARAADLGSDTAAVRGLAAALRDRPLAILALGPLTTVASALIRHPELHVRITRIVMVAGRRPGQLFRSAPSQRDPFPDFNFENDPAAAAVILATTIPLALAPWEVASHVWITGADLETLAALGTSGAWLAARCASWLAVWRRDLGTDGFNPFDTLAVSWLTHPHLIDHADVAVTVDPGPAASRPAATRPDARALRSDVELVAHFQRAGGRRAVYCCTPRPELKPILLERLARRASG
jgi:inosine-uridine nucleoside N-ribohydrolase